jgi:hypothetical protein
MDGTTGITTITETIGTTHIVQIMVGTVDTETTIIMEDTEVITDIV